MRHLPTGIEAKAAAKSQHANRKSARAMLEARVKSFVERGKSEARDAQRRELAGSGMRGDKIRTYREQDDTVNDHRTGEKHRLSSLKKGLIPWVK